MLPMPPEWGIRVQRTPLLFSTPPPQMSSEDNTEGAEPGGLFSSDTDGGTNYPLIWKDHVFFRFSVVRLYGSLLYGQIGLIRKNPISGFLITLASNLERSCIFSLFSCKIIRIVVIGSDWSYQKKSYF